MVAPLAVTLPRSELLQGVWKVFEFDEGSDCHHCTIFCCWCKTDGCLRADMKIGVAAVDAQCFLIECGLFCLQILSPKSLLASYLRWCGRRCFINCLLELLISIGGSPRSVRESMIILRMALQPSPFSSRSLSRVVKKA